MRKLVLFTMAVFSLSFISGCGGSSEHESGEGGALNDKSLVEERIAGEKGAEVTVVKDDGTSGVSNLNPLLLEGIWSQDCISYGLKSYKNQLVYEGSGIRIQGYTYSDPECNTAFSRSEITADFEFGESYSLVDGGSANKVKYVVGSVGVVFFDRVVISEFNSEQLCDAGPWKAGEIKNVMNCNAFKSLWSIDKDAFVLEGESLSVGDLSFIDDDGFPELLNTYTYTYREPASIVGSWLMDCEVDNGNQANIKSITISDFEFNKRFDSYEDTACELKQYSIVDSGTFLVGQEVTLTSGLIANEMTMNSNSRTLAFYSDFYLTVFNDSSFCGFSDWSKGEFKDVTYCESFNVETEVKDIFFIEEDRLYLGDDSALNDEGYPEQLDDTYFTLQ